MFVHSTRLFLAMVLASNIAFGADPDLMRLEKKIQRLERQLGNARNKMRLRETTSSGVQQRSHTSSYRTENFIVVAQSAAMAKQTAEAAEELRGFLGMTWIGRRLDSWDKPCQLEVHMGSDAREGQTSYSFRNGKAIDFKMKLSGSKTELMNQLLPHEVLHTVFATHFQRPIPRWADEGAAVSVEPLPRQVRHEEKLKQLVLSGRTMPLSRLFALQNYPNDVAPLFAQGQSVVRFLLAHKGRKTFVAFVDDGLKNGDWNAAVKSHYSYDDLEALQLAWTRSFDTQEESRAKGT